MHRYNCIRDGKGFNAKGWEETKFCSKKCKKEHFGKEWKPGMFKTRTKSMTTEEKLMFAESIVTR